MRYARSGSDIACAAAKDDGNGGSSQNAAKGTGGLLPTSRFLRYFQYGQHNAASRKSSPLIPSGIRVVACGTDMLYGCGSSERRGKQSSEGEAHPKSTQETRVHTGFGPHCIWLLVCASAVILRCVGRMWGGCAVRP